MWPRTSLAPTRVVHVRPTGDTGFLRQLMDELGAPPCLTLDPLADGIAGIDDTVVFGNRIREQDLSDFETVPAALRQLTQQQRLRSLVVVSAPLLRAAMSQVAPYADRMYNTFPISG